jgi:hypothetical protein
MTELLRCPSDGRPIDTKWVGKWSECLFLAFCHCGKIHELVMTELVRCPSDGRPIDTKSIRKWSERLFLAFCHCGEIHELTLTKNPAHRCGRADYE